MLLLICMTIVLSA